MANDIWKELKRINDEINELSENIKENARNIKAPVSYTHLTLPTN